jgi:hypothetical protein
MRPPLLIRLRWWLEDLRDAPQAKVAAGLLALVALVLGGFFAARMAARSSPAAAAPESVTRVITVRHRVLQREQGQGSVVSRTSVREVRAPGHTLIQTQTIHGASSIHLVTNTAARYVTGSSRTVVRPVTNTQIRTVRQVVTVTHPVTVVKTTTVVSTKLITVPVTVTVTLPVP